MKTLLKLTFLLIAITIIASCKKPIRSPDNECDGLLNESPPLKIGIVLADRPTGQNLILQNGLTPAEVKITLSGSSKPLYWRIINTAGSPLNGMIELTNFHEQAGEYRYKIEAKGLKDVEFSYKIKQVKSDHPCRIYSYPMEGLKALNFNYTQMEVADKAFPNGIRILLD